METLRKLIERRRAAIGRSSPRPPLTVDGILAKAEAEVGLPPGDCLGEVDRMHRIIAAGPLPPAMYRALAAPTPMRDEINRLMREVRDHTEVERSTGTDDDIVTPDAYRALVARAQDRHPLQ